MNHDSHLPSPEMSARFADLLTCLMLNIPRPRDVERLLGELDGLLQDSNPMQRFHLWWNLGRGLFESTNIEDYTTEEAVRIYELLDFCSDMVTKNVIDEDFSVANALRFKVHQLRPQTDLCKDVVKDHLTIVAEVACLPNNRDF